MYNHIIAVVLILHRELTMKAKKKLAQHHADDGDDHEIMRFDVDFITPPVTNTQHIYNL
jgi:hypothetical protein